MRDRRRRAALAGAVLLLAAAGAFVLALARSDDAPPAVLPDSLVRIDPETLEPAQVVQVGNSPDLVLASGGFVWITHQVLRDVSSDRLRNAGDRKLTRVDPNTGEAITVGGGLAPCGLAGDPSGDVWVANCFAAGGGPPNVVRVDASTLEFEATWPAPRGRGFYRGVAYGDGALWVSELGEVPKPHSVTRIDPKTGKQLSSPIRNAGTGALAWSEGYGELWIGNFGAGTVTRIHASTGKVETIDARIRNPAPIVAAGDVAWVGDWAGPHLARFAAADSPTPRVLRLPARNALAGVWSIAAGEGYIWAATPRDHALWRIDPTTNEATRIEMPYFPSGVATSGGEVWVTVRRS